MPATGFYEWRKDGDRKVPTLLRPRAGHMAFAGLWQRWWDPEFEKDVDTFTIVTCPPNAVVAPIHDRMPVILPEPAWADWLAAGPDAARALLVPCADDVLEAVEVGDAVNKIGNEGPELAKPVG